MDFLTDQVNINNNISLVLTSFILKLFVDMINKITKVPVKRLSGEQLQSALSSVPKWRLQENEISREYTLSNFEQTWVRSIQVINIFTYLTHQTGLFEPNIIEITPLGPSSNDINCESSSFHLPLHRINTHRHTIKSR